MAILDCMLLNALIMWNLSCAKVDDRRELTRYEFLLVVSHQLLHFKTEELVSPPRTRLGNRGGRTFYQDDEGSEGDKETPKHTMVQGGSQNRCVVCNLEIRQYNRVIKKHPEILTDVFRKKIVNEALLGVRKQISKCIECGAHAHNAVLVHHKKFIHDMFPAMTCMEILHSKVGKEIWQPNPNGTGRLCIHYGHDIVEELGNKIKERLM
jgi:hypothetical protein